MATIAKLQVELGLDSSGVDRGLAPAKKAFGGLGTMLKDVASTAVGFALGNAINLVARNVGQLASAGLDFGAQMANVNSIIQVSDAQLAGLSDQVVKLAEDPRISQGPAELAAGLYNIVQSGFSASDSLGILTQASIAATAGLTSSATATNAIVSVLNAYHESADQAGAISNSLFQIVNAGVITFDQLANTIGTVLPTAASLGVSLDDLGAAYVVLTRQGISADEATTQINSVLVGLLNPTTALTDALHAYGYESGAALLKTKGFGGAMEVLNTIIGGNADVATAMFGNVRALRGILGLTTNSGKDFTAAIKEMGHAQDGAGATAKALDKQMKSASYQLQQAKKWMVIAATLGMGALSPAIIAGAKAFVYLMQTGIIPLIGVLSNLLAALAPVAHAIGDLAGVMVTAWQGGKSFSDQISQLPGALQPLGLALVQITHGVELLVRAFDKDGLKGVLDALPHSFDLLGAGLSGLGSVIGDFAGSVFSGLVDALSNVDWGSVAGIAWTLLKTAVTNLVSLGLDLGKIAVNVAGWAIGAIPDVFDWLTNHVFGSHPEGDGTSMQTTGGMTLSDIVVNVLSWAKGAIVDISVAIYGWVKGAAVTLSDWTLNVAVPTVAYAAGVSFDSIKTAVHDKITPMAVDLGGWTLNVGAPTIVFTGTFGAAELAKGIAHLLVDTKIGLVSWILSVGIPASITIGPLLVPYVAVYLSQKMGVIGLVNWTLKIAEAPVMALQRAGLIEDAVKGFVTSKNIAVSLVTWTLDVGKPLIPSLGSFSGLINLSIWIAEALPLIGPVVKLVKWTLGLDAPSLPDLTFANLALWIADAVVMLATLGTVGVNADGLKWNISIPTPDFPDLSLDKLKQWLIDKLKALGKISIDLPNPLDINIPGLGGGDSGSGSGSDTGGTAGGGGFGLIGAGKNGIGSLGAGLADRLAKAAQTSLTFTATFKADDSDVAKKYTDVMTWGGIWNKAAFTGRFLGDDGDTAKKFTDSMTWGTIWGKSAFTGRFLGDSGNAAQKFTDAMSWGNIWGGSAFTAKFAANNGPAATAYTDAFRWGDAWDGTVFTASFAIDVSGLYSALNTAYYVAQAISDIMPHSPAKKGPLSRPITFDYIGDNFARMASRVTSMAGGVSSAVADAFTPNGMPSIPAYANGASFGGNGGISVTMGDLIIQDGDKKNAKQIADEVGAAIVREMSLR